MSDIIDELCAFYGSDALGDGDFSVCVRGAAEIIRLRAELATARREGMAQAVAILRARHRGLEHIREWRESQHCADEIEAAIRAAAGEVKP